MRGDKHGFALFGQSINQIPEVASRLRVDATRGFVQKHDLRIVKQGAPQRQSLLVSQRQIVRESIRFVCQLHIFEQLPTFGLERRPIESVNTGVKFDIFSQSQIFIKGKFLTHISDSLLDLFVFFPDIEARHRTGALGGQEETAQHADGRGFARAICAQKAKNLPVIYGQIQILDRPELAEAFAQLFRVNGVRFQFETSCSFIRAKKVSSMLG